MQTLRRESVAAIVRVVSKVSGVRCQGNRSRVGASPPPRNVAAMEPAITDPLKSATLWGGVGGGDTRQIAMPRSPGP
jgi:hypothetical protein